jgi:hypothetical protein
MSQTQEAILARCKQISKDFHAIPISLDPVFTDLTNPMQSHIPTSDILARAIILILLQCAARMFQDQQVSTQAFDLIKCADFREILQIGFRAKFNKVAHLNTLNKVGLEPTTAEKWP